MSSPSGSGARSTSLVSRLPVPIEFDLALDRRMFVYTLALSLLTAVLCGLAPARSATRMTVVPALKLAVGEHDTRPERQRMRHWLVVGQVALSCALLVWAGLFARSLSNAHQVDLGFDPAGVCWRTCNSTTTSTRSGAIVPQLAELQTPHQRAPRRSGSGAGEDRSACVQGPRRNADAHGNRPTATSVAERCSSIASAPSGFRRCGFRCGQDAISVARTASGRRASWS